MNDQSWHFVTYQPRQIYILRDVGGKVEALKLADQTTFKEWSGCFSAI